MKRLAPVLVALASWGCNGSPASAPAPHAPQEESAREPQSAPAERVPAGTPAMLAAKGDEGRLPVIAVYATPGQRYQEQRDAILVVWASGRVVWSEGAIGGGKPYREGRVGPERIESALKALSAAGIFESKALRQPRFGPDSATTVIAIAHGKLQLHAESWHELYEQNAGVVATDHGLRSLNEGETRADALAKADGDYRRFREEWTAVRRELNALRELPGRAVELEFELIARWENAPRPK